MWGGSWQLQIAYGGNSGEAHTWYREDGKRWHYKVRGCGVNTNVYSIINYNGMLINIWKIDAFGAKGKREMRCWMIEVKYLCVWNPVLKPVEQHLVDSEWSLHPQLHLGYLFTYIKYLLQKLLLLGVKKIMLGPVASEKKDVWSRISLPRNAVVVQKVPRYVCVVQHWEEGTTLLEHRRKSFRGKTNKQTKQNAHILFRFCELALTPPSSCAFPLCWLVGIVLVLGSNSFWECSLVSLICYPDFKENAQNVCPCLFHQSELVDSALGQVCPREGSAFTFGHVLDIELVYWHTQLHDFCIFFKSLVVSFCSALYCK